MLYRFSTAEAEVETLWSQQAHTSWYLTLNDPGAEEKPPNHTKIVAQTCRAELSLDEKPHERSYLRISTLETSEFTHFTCTHDCQSLNPCFNFRSTAEDQQEILH